MVFSRWFVCSLIGNLREQVRHPIHAPAPVRLELVECLTRPADGIGVGADALFPSAALLGDQAGPLQHRDVLLDRGEAHGVYLGQPRHCQLVFKAAAEDVAAGGVGERVEHAVGSLVGEHIYNHLVVD